MTTLALVGRGVVSSLVCGVLVIVGGHAADAQKRVEKNVVYGMYSGAALLMDVYHPTTPNGAGVIYVPGSAWQAPLGYNAPSLKDQRLATEGWVPMLQRAGYAVFVVNHRAAPRFAFPTPLADVQRAIRFVRHHAARYRIDGNRLGGMGHSSGGHLIGLAAVVAAASIADDDDPVNREPATLQAAVLRAAPTDLQRMPVGTGAVAILMAQPTTSNPESRKALATASPVTHVTRSSPPVLLVHGDADDQVPVEQSAAMHQALEKGGAVAGFVRVPGGDHAPDLRPAETVAEVMARAFSPLQGPQVPDFMRESRQWSDRHLRAPDTKKPTR
jgi:acetyl esterase/lipase